MTKVVECESCGRRMPKPPKHVIEWHEGKYCRECREAEIKKGIEKEVKRICEEGGLPEISIEDASKYFHELSGDLKDELMGAHVSHKLGVPPLGDTEEETREWLRKLGEAYEDEERKEKALERMRSSFRR